MGSLTFDPSDSEKYFLILLCELVEIDDSAQSSFSTTISISPKPTGVDDNDTFDSIDERGFWTTGDFTISYSVVDEFQNQFEKDVTLSVRDNTDPHVFLISHLSHEQLLSGKSFSDISTANYFTSAPQLANNISHPAKVFSGELYPNDSSVLAKFSSSNYVAWFNNESNSIGRNSPYLAKDGNGSDNKNFIFKISEVNSPSVQSLNEETIALTDRFGRKYYWYSPLTISFTSDPNLFFQDPGLLIYESSDEEVSITSTLNVSYHGDSDQIQSILVESRVQQENGQSTTVERSYSFLDDISPTLFVEPSTNNSDKFILVEAGQSYSDFNGTYYLWENGSKGEIINRSVSASDVVDDDQDLVITRTYIDVSDNTNSTNPDAIIDPYSLGSIYKIRYDVMDSEGNSAEPAFRWLIVKDTTAPVISLPTGSTDLTFASTSQSNPDSRDLISVKEFMLTGLYVYDNYENSIRAEPPINDDVAAGSTPWEFNSTSDIWNISIEKYNDVNLNDPFNGDPYQEGAVYPTGPESETYGDGYLVEISVSDSSGNISDVFTRRLKVGDYDAPVITLIGKSRIHDFFRYGRNNSLPNNQKLFDDQTNSGEYNSSGYSGGSHRLILSDYNFVDPGAYAEDGNLTEYQGFFNTAQGFPDFDGDGIGEGHAIQQVTQESKMLNPEEPGIIYAYRSSQKSTRELQDILEQNLLPADFNDSAYIPDVVGENYDFNTTDKALTDDEKITIDIIEITIQYNVKDGWGNEPNEPYVRRGFHL